jgi:adenylate cyclase class IV
MEEKEIKIQTTEGEALKAQNKLAQFFKFHKKQKDVYYDTRDLFFEKKKHSIRLRYEGKETILALKILYWMEKRKEWFIFEKELKAPFDSSEVKKLFNIIGLKLGVEDGISPVELKRILYNSGLTEMIVIDKDRNVYEFEGAEVSVDRIKKLGTFIEIEKSDEPWSVLRKIRVKKRREIRAGYTSLFVRKFFNFSESDLIKFYALNPCWNVLKSEAKMYEDLNQKEYYYVGISGIAMDLNIIHLLESLKSEKNRIYKVFAVFWDDVIQTSPFTEKIFANAKKEGLIKSNLNCLTYFFEKNFKNSWELSKITDLTAKLLSKPETRLIINKILEECSLEYLNSKFDKKDIDMHKILNIIHDYLIFYNSEDFFGKKIGVYFVGDRHKYLRGLLNKHVVEKNYQQTRYFKSMSMPATGMKIRVNPQMSEKEIKRTINDWMEDEKNKNEKTEFLKWLKANDDIDEIYDKISEKYKELLGVNLNSKKGQC